MLKVSVDLIRPDIRSHRNNGSRGAMLANVHGCRNTIEPRHNNVHEHQVEMIPA